MEVEEWGKRMVFNAKKVVIGSNCKGRVFRVRVYNRVKMILFVVRGLW